MPRNYPAKACYKYHGVTTRSWGATALAQKPTEKLYLKTGDPPIPWFRTSFFQTPPTSLNIILLVNMNIKFYPISPLKNGVCEPCLFLNQELTIHNQVKPNSCDAKAQAETATA